jgi:Flp pilus assembly protein TadB
METVLLLVAVAAAGLACPAMMWWQRRRGRDAACCMPAAQTARSAEVDATVGLDELNRRRADLEARIAELEPPEAGAVGGPSVGRGEPR